VASANELKIPTMLFIFKESSWQFLPASFVPLFRESLLFCVLSTKDHFKVIEILFFFNR